MLRQGGAEAMLRVPTSTHQYPPVPTRAQHPHHHVYSIEINTSVFILGSESLNNLAQVTQLVPGKDLKEARLTSEHAILALH